MGDWMDPRVPVITLDNCFHRPTIICCLNTRMIVSHRHKLIFTHIPRTRAPAYVHGSNVGFRMPMKYQMLTST